MQIIILVFLISLRFAKDIIFERIIYICDR